jgi:hypothetical protein
LYPLIDTSTSAPVVAQIAVTAAFAVVMNSGSIPGVGFDSVIPSVLQRRPHYLLYPMTFVQRERLLFIGT